jgi:hypothetical protein
MKEIKLGGVNLTCEPQDSHDPYIMGIFGAEGTGKTQFPLTGPDLVAVVPLERKSYFTIEKYERETGKRILRPKDPEVLIVNPRKANIMEAQFKGARTEKDKETLNLAVRKYYRDCVERIKDVTYALLEHGEVRLLAIDTFGQMCSLIDSALYGFVDKFIKVEGQLYKDRREFNQEIIDFLNSLSVYRKHVILTHKAKDEYAKTGPTGRLTWEGFKFLGNHTNVLVEFEANKKWNPDSENEERRWHWQVNIRKCQANPLLEGPEGNPLAQDDLISFAGLILAIDPEADAGDLM